MKQLWGRRKSSKLPGASIDVAAATSESSLGAEQQQQPQPQPQQGDPRGGVFAAEPLDSRPPDDELNNLYGIYLDELKIPPGHRSRMLRQPAHVKWKALSNHQHLLGVQSTNAALNVALRCGELLDRALQHPPSFPLEDAVELRVQLGSNGDWMPQFLDEGGLDKHVMPRHCYVTATPLDAAIPR